ncbi:MAG: 23S rRNA (uracil(1939)-C(5))-methyltransferase RlmD [Bacteroidota bacterium]
MGKKKVLPVVENLEISDTGSEGQSLGRANGMVVFVKNTVPGDVVDVQLTRKKNKYAEGRPVRFHTYSAQRTEPLCRHFGTCGGCKWQNMNYSSQLEYKQKQVLSALERIGKLDIPEIRPIVPSAKQYYYRNKLEYTFSNKKWLTEAEIASGEAMDRNALGFHIPGMFDKVLDVEECHLQPPPSDAIRNAIKKYAAEKGLSFFDIRQQSGFLRNLVIRNTSSGRVMVILSFFTDEAGKREALLGHLADSFPQITSLNYVINPKKNDTISDLEIICYRGDDAIYEEMEGLRFRIGPKSFYQTNPEQAYELYRITREFAGLSGEETVYDLYTGTGTIANFIARQARKVVGMEYVPAAIEDARINSKLNNIDNTVFFAGDIKDLLSADLVGQQGRPDVIITDPPRAGMHGDVTRKIMEIAPARIVYVSCNPATQARDLATLSEKYRITGLQPVDMFPQTAHVENVALLELLK